MEKIFDPIGYLGWFGVKYDPDPTKIFELKARGDGLAYSLGQTFIYYVLLKIMKSF